MPVKQTHYTSARMGRNGHAGFGFHAVSDGVDEGDLQQIGLLGELTLPRDLDLGAAPAELIARAPVLLRYRILESGRWVLLRSRYAGTDYSGRSGNFFAHALIGDADALRHWPVDYCDAPRWQERLEHDDGQPPPTLPDLDLGGVSPPARLALDALAGFLSAAPERPQRLVGMIRAALARGETDRALLLRAPLGDQGLTWIACIQKAFPRLVARALSFCTYQFDAYQAEAINVSVGDTNLLFDDTDFSYRYFAFDLFDGRASDIPDRGAEYADVIADWMTAAPQRLAAFHSFMEGFDLTTLDTGVLHGLRLFRLDQGEIALPVDAELTALLGFVRERTRPELHERIQSLLAKQLDAPADLTAADYGTLIDFFAQTAAITGKSAHREQAIAAWQQMFDQLVARRGIGLAETGAAKTALLAQDPGGAADLARHFVADEHLDAIYPALRETEATTVCAVADELIAQLAVAEPDLAWPQSRGAAYLAGLAAASPQPESLLDRLLGAVADRPTELAAACALLAETLLVERPTQADALLETLGRRLARLGDAPRGLRERLDRPELHPLLRGDWLERLDSSDDPSALLARYLGVDLPQTPAFAEVADSWLRSRGFERLDAKAAAEQAKHWLLAGELGRLEPQPRQRAAELLNAGLPMRSKDRDQRAVAEALATLAAEHALPLTPNRALIFATTARVIAGDKIDWAALPDQLRDHLDVLTGKDYRLLLEQLLPAALADCRDYRVHGQRVVALLSPKRRETLIRVYRTTLVYGLDDPDALRQATKYWLVDAAQRPDHRLEPDIAEILAAGLAHLKPPKRAALIAKIDKDTGIPAEVKPAWQKVQAVSDGKRGGLAKLTGSVRRLFRSSRGDAKSKQR